MNHRTRTYIYVVTAIILVVVLTSPRLRRLISGPGENGQENGRDTRLPASAIVARPGVASNTILATGTVLANEEVELRSEITGKVVKILFAEGSRVRRGDLLVKIDDSELLAQRAKLESQKKVALDKERRRKLLYDKQNISSEEYEVALNELNGINAEIQLVEAKIRKTELLAPFDGVIGLRSVSEGSYVSPDTRIAALQNVGTVKVDFAVPEKYAPLVKKGLPVRFSVSGGAGPHEGRILAVEPKIDPATRNVLIRAVAPNEHGDILPGGFAGVELTLERIPDALMIPTEAVVPDLEGQKVYIFRGGIAQEARVEIGLRTESKIQITKGLQPYDTVLTSGLLQVSPGLPVRLTEVR